MFTSKIGIFIDEAFIKCCSLSIRRIGACVAFACETIAPLVLSKYRESLIVSAWNSEELIMNKLSYYEWNFYAQIAFYLSREVCIVIPFHRSKLLFHLNLKAFSRNNRDASSAFNKFRYCFLCLKVSALDFHHITSHQQNECSSKVNYFVYFVIYANKINEL